MPASDVPATRLPPTGWIARRFGTYRGLIRLILSLAQHWRGAYRPIETVDWSKFERLVFVCAGNVCRSPYGHYRALQHFSRVASLGLFTDSGRLPEPSAVAAAARRHIDMRDHRATAIDDFIVEPGDLFLIMEDRHLAPLQAKLLTKGAPHAGIALLGSWARPRRPLIYDPMDLSDAYFDTCYSAIDSAVARLLAEYCAARAVDVQEAPHPAAMK